MAAALLGTFVPSIEVAFPQVWLAPGWTGQGESSSILCLGGLWLALRLLD